MNFFDELIEYTEATLDGKRKAEYSCAPEKAWEDAGRNEVILRRDTAFELNGVGFNLITGREIESGITVYGGELASIRADCRFARICLISINDAEDEQKTYDLIRKIEYVKYHCFPKGYMMRTSTQGHREAVRVSKSALRDGISFEKVGNLLINAYTKNRAVKGIRIIFVTDQSVDFGRLEKAARKNHDITETLNHIMNNVQFDCSTCNLKPICDEVEGMRELHFKKAGV